MPRTNRFNEEQVENGPGLLISEMNHEQIKKYQQLQEKSLKRERSSLSHSRYNKMKTLILREVKNAIQEADYEPTASHANMMSMIQQNEDDMLGVGRNLPRFKGSFRNFSSFIVSKE
jgi:hypothetical protein